MKYNYFHLFLEASLVVQIVIVILLVSSCISWAIIIEKMFLISTQANKLKRFEIFYIKNRGTDEQTIRSLVTNSETYGSLITYNSFRKMREFVIDNNNEEYSSEELKNLILQNFTVRIRLLENKLEKLGTIASVTPFVGLLGTVFGIMNSFQAIGESKSVDLAVVAPGIAEALFTTALGLFVAIPALVYYNKFAHQIDYIYDCSENFFNDVSVIIANILYSKK